MTLNELESAVLSAMIERSPDERVLLEMQVRSSRVISRENTGAGFYTRLQAEPSVTKLTDKAISNVSAEVGGLKNPMVFVLFVKDGFIELLEGATVADSSVGIDFSNVTFKML